MSKLTLQNPALRHVDRVIAVGTPFEVNNQFKKGFMAARRNLDYQSVVTQTGLEEKSKKAIQGELGKLIDPEKITVIASDIGSTRKFKIDVLAEYASGLSNNAAVAMITSKQEFLGEHSTMEEFARAGGFDLEKLAKVGYIFAFDGKHEMYSSILSLHEDRINFEADSRKVIAVVEDMPSYYTGFLNSLYKLIDKEKYSIQLALDFEGAKRIIEVAGGRIGSAVVDMRFPSKGRISADACWQVEALLRQTPGGKNMPIIMESLDMALVKMAEEKADGKTLFALPKNEFMFWKIAKILNEGIFADAG